MKPFLGIDITTDKKNEKINGEEFLIATPSEVMTQTLENSTEEAEETIKKSMLPKPLRILQLICGTVGMIIVLSLLKALTQDGGISIAQAYKNAPGLFWISGICLLIWGLLILVGVKKQKEVMESDEGSHTFSKFDGVCEAVYNEMSVPSAAKEVDVLSFFYKTKNGNVKVCENETQIAKYFNPVFKIFADSENLYLANLEGKYAFKLSSLIAIRTVKKRISVLSWNKEEKFNKGEYKQYKLTRDNYDCIHCKKYHILEFNHADEVWGIYIPVYDLPFFEEITGLKAE